MAPPSKTEPPLELDATPPDSTPVEPIYGRQLAAGAQVGEYIVERLCSRGGFAAVYRATHCQSGERAALKVLHWHLSQSPDMIARFQREAETVARIHHPNIVDLLEFGALHDGRPFYIMQWLDGRTLEEELRSRGAFSVAEALIAMERLCDALSTAHAAGVIHRDLKATNIMLVPEADWFQIVLVDFGIAKLLPTADGDSVNVTGQTLKYTSTGQRFGSPHVMAPEQILGRPIDSRTDIYALGVVLYLLVTARYPFAADTFVEVEEMHLSSPPPRASKVAPVPTAIDEVIQRCMEKKPEARYSRVEELMAALRFCAQPGEDPVHAHDLRVPERSRAVGAHVSVRLDCDGEIDDELFDAVDELLDRARRDLQAAGMEIVAESGSGFLAAATLPGDPAGDRGQREHVLGAVLSLADSVSASDGDPRMRLELTVHAAPLSRVASAGRADDLLRLNEWLGGHHNDVVVIATDEALRALEKRFRTKSLPGRPEARWVIATRG